MLTHHYHMVTGTVLYDMMPAVKGKGGIKQMLYPFIPFYLKIKT